MKTLAKLLIVLLIFAACKPTQAPETNTSTAQQIDADVIIAFGSCNDQDLENPLWDDVLANNPSYWIWGGDNIYSDTDDMQLMARHYEKQLAQKGYKEIMSKLKIHGTWDDHDYGLNDGGLEFKAKKGSQQLLLDFLGVSKEDQRRKREGVYYSEMITTAKGSVKLIVLDLRYHRTSMQKSTKPNTKFEKNSYGEGSMLGEAQWKWLENELNVSQADFNMVISSIQVLPEEHGYEKWANMPHEVDRFKKLVKSSKAKAVIVLSGDRHISEFSKTTIEGVDYPLIDFTSSGLTHSYDKFTSEPNRFRVGKVVSDKSFGIIKVKFETKTLILQMRGDKNRLQQELIQGY
ncbi:MAG: alkaline phosphatase family protein [Bacteroidia bacterium]|nr:alkaline phosphatase family protein [Bacteroidia bacterium]